MADAMFMYAATTGFFTGLVAILFGIRARRNSRSASASVMSGSGGVVSNT
jgi:hypothetical protein